MKRWNFRASSQCPFCNQEEDSTIHIMQCNNEYAKELWKETQWEWIKSAYKIDTCPRAIISIIGEMDKWREGKKQDERIEHGDQLKDVLRSQKTIGWKIFMEGLIAK